MSDRCIVAARFTQAGSVGQVRKAVGGFLRYVQHRDLHPAEKDDRAAPQDVAGLLKYAAYRDKANSRAELFGRSGPASSADRKAFAAFVDRSLAESKAQLYCNRNGELVDRRRAVYRLVISPERAQGLDLAELTRRAVSAMERDADAGELRWIAAIHRNTAHPHVHLVIAGMRQTGASFARVELTKTRLAALKSAVNAEIERQRGAVVRVSARADRAPIGASALALELPSATTWNRSRLPVAASARSHHPSRSASILRLRAAARRYGVQVQRDAAAEARLHGWQYAA